MVKRMMAFAVAIVMTASLLAGCGSADTGASAATAPEATVKAEAGTAAEAEAKPPVKIVWFDENAYALDKMDAILAGLKDEENIEIEVEHSANNYFTVLKTKINSGDAPDIYQTKAGTDNKTYAEYSYDYTNEEVVKKFTDDAIEQCVYQGKVTGLPWNYQTFSLLYNKKLFADAGITELPKTLTELGELCEKLKAKGITPFANGYKEYWVFRHIIDHFMAAEGKEPATLAEEITNGSVKIGDLKYMKNSFAFIDLTIKYGLPKPLEIGWEESENDLALGKAAMIHMGDWCEPTLKKVNPDIQVGFLPLPVGDDPGSAKVLANVSWVWRVYNDSENLDAAKKALEYFLTSDKGIELNANDLSSVIAIKGSTVKPSGMLANSALEIMSGGDFYPWPHMSWPDGFDQKLGNLYQAYIVKAKTGDQVLNELTDTWLKMSQE